MSEPEQERDELGAVVPPPEARRGLAESARRLSNDPAFVEASRRLTQEYLKRFCAVRHDDPLHERMCVRTQIAVNVVGDVLSQLAIMADFGKVEDAALKKTMRGNDNGR